MNIEINVTKPDGIVETVRWDNVCVNHIRRIEQAKRAAFSSFMRPIKSSAEIVQHLNSSRREFLDIKGGTTIIAYTRNGRAKTAMSTCSPNENFCRRTGIGAAVVNFVNTHIKNGPFTLDSFEYPPQDSDTYRFSFIPQTGTEPDFWYLKAIARVRKTTRTEFLNKGSNHVKQNISS